MNENKNEVTVDAPAGASADIPTYKPGEMILNAIRLEIWATLEKDPRFSVHTMKRIETLASHARRIHASFAKSVAEAQQHDQTGDIGGDADDEDTLGDNIYRGGIVGVNPQQDFLRQILMMVQPALERMANPPEPPKPYEPKPFRVFDDPESRLQRLIHMRADLARMGKDTNGIDKKIDELMKIVENTPVEEKAEENEHERVKMALPANPDHVNVMDAG